MLANLADDNLVIFSLSVSLSFFFFFFFFFFLSAFGGEIFYKFEYACFPDAFYNAV